MSDEDRGPDLEMLHITKTQALSDGKLGAVWSALD